MEVVMERKVELKTAFHWHCEDCGEENFSLPKKAELTDREAEEAYRQFHELDEWNSLPRGWSQFESVQIPDTVTCKRCGSTFGTTEESDA